MSEEDKVVPILATEAPVEANVEMPVTVQDVPLEAPVAVTMAEPEPKEITLDDLEKTEDYYNKMIDAIVLNPAAYPASALADTMSALDSLNILREELEGEDYSGDENDR